MDYLKQQLEEIAGRDDYLHCYNSAVRLLGYRPRSESEIRQRLSRRGFDGALDLPQ